MQQLLILIFFIALSAFSTSDEAIFEVSTFTASAIAVLSMVACALAILAAGALARWRIGRRSLQAPPRWFYSITSFYPFLVVFIYLINLSLGWLFILRNQFPASWFLPEVAILMQPIALLAFGYAVVTWVKQKVKEIKLAQTEGSIHTVDDPAHPSNQSSLAGQDPDRPGIHGILDALLNYLRHNVAIVAVPLIIIVAWHRIVEIYLSDPALKQYSNWQTPLALLGTLTVFLIAPVIITSIWNTHALPQGPLNESLLAMCRRYGIGVKRILVWHTKGTLINAAVLGATARFRFILLTDALLDKVHPILIQAVMAHEVAHIRLRHIPWLLASAAAALLLTGFIAETLVSAAIPGVKDLLFPWPALHEKATHLLQAESFLMIIVSAITLALWAPIFGWVSRRFERQADTFAVEHFATQHASVDSLAVISEHDAQAMVGALDAVANLNAIPVTQKSWRHGAIRWRQDYLLSLIGKHVGSPDIHRVITAIKLCTLLIFTCIAALTAAEIYFQQATPENPDNSSATAQINIP
jgi:STE24 endopeptidase